MSVQNMMNGGQLRDIFAAYNAFKGSEVVNMGRTYNLGDSYSNQIANGNQIDLALAEINAAETVNIFTTPTIEWGGDVAYKKTIETRLNELILGASAAPVWHDLTSPIFMSVGDAFPIGDLNTKTSGAETQAFAIASGSLPAGLTFVGATGLITVTVSTVSKGTVSFTSTNSNGVRTSEVIKWTVATA